MTANSMFPDARDLPYAVDINGGSFQHEPLLDPLHPINKPSKESEGPSKPFRVRPVDEVYQDVALAPSVICKPAWTHKYTFKNHRPREPLPYISPLSTKAIWQVFVMLKRFLPPTELVLDILRRADFDRIIVSNTVDKSWDNMARFYYRVDRANSIDVSGDALKYQPIVATPVIKKSVGRGRVTGLKAEVWLQMPDTVDYIWESLDFAIIPASDRPKKVADKEVITDRKTAWAIRRGADASDDSVDGLKSIRWTSMQRSSLTESHPQTEQHYVSRASRPLCHIILTLRIT